MYARTAPAPQKKMLVVLSGGLDSATALNLAILNSQEIAVLNFNYNQRHDREIKSALALCEHYSIKERYFFESPDLAFIHPPFKYIGGGLEPLLPVTWKPGRNMVFLAYATSLSYTVGASIVVTGIHQEDYPGYPDCRELFLANMEITAQAALSTPIQLWTPFLHKTKTEIVKLGIELGTPYRLTWTCYLGGEKPCHTCDACIRRERAFVDNGTTDPLLKE